MGNIRKSRNRGLTPFLCPRSYLWGLDLAEQEGRGPARHSSPGATAGGVGGLLAIRIAGSNEVLLPTYDGHGNVMTLVDADNGTVVAEYEYGPFGELLRSTGPMAIASPFGFSTKYTDSETGLVYYGYRFYNPDTGRFLNHDPIEEAGGLNLYGFVGNDPVNQWDYLGLATIGEKTGAIWSARVASSSLRPYFEGGIIPIYTLHDDEDEMTPIHDYLIKDSILNLARQSNQVGMIRLRSIDLRRYLSSGNFEHYNDSTNFGTGWWLGGAEALYARGDVCVSGHDVYVLALDLIWHDTIDANPSGENPWKDTIERVYGIVIGKGLRVDFKVDIKWSIYFKKL